MFFLKGGFKYTSLLCLAIFSMQFSQCNSLDAPVRELMHLKTCSNQFVQGKSSLHQAAPSKLMTTGQKSGCPKILFTMAVVTGSRHACLRYLSSIYPPLLTFGFNLLTPDLVMTGILREFLLRFSGLK